MGPSARWSGGAERDVSLRVAIERARYRPQDAGPARDRDVADDRDRSGRRRRQPDHRAGTRVGEWIASDWPVCAISETATPHRMGAALTYARRYALFTLVGIAGEDDLDAPDLMTPTSQSPGPQKPEDDNKGRLNGNQHHPAQRPPLGRNGKAHSTITVPMLGPESSAELRDRLIIELNDLACGDDAALWAHRCLVEKNRLTAADAQRVEEAFQEDCRPWWRPLEMNPRHRAKRSNSRVRRSRPRKRQRRDRDRRSSTKACWQSRSRVGFVIAITSGMWPGSLA